MPKYFMENNTEKTSFFNLHRYVLQFRTDGCDSQRDLVSFEKQKYIKQKR